MKRRFLIDLENGGIGVCDKEKHNAVDRVPIEELYGLAIRRYQRELPEKELTPSVTSAIWYSIAGMLEREGQEAARKYVMTAELIK